MSTTQLFGIDPAVLVNQTGQPCLSIFMPTGHGGSQAPRDQLTLRKLLGQAEADLRATAVPAERIEAMLKPVRGLLSRDNFWKNLQEGLAIFSSPVIFTYSKFAQPAAEIAVVGKRFYLKGLLPLIQPDGRFYLLALSKSQVRLIQATRFTVKELDLPEGIPPNLAATAHFVRTYGELQNRPGPGPLNGARPVAYYYGRGSVEDVEKNDLQIFCSEVEAGVKKFLGDQKTPLVVAGVAYLAAIYRQVNTYSHLLETQIDGSPDDFSSVALAHKAWPLVEPFYRTDETQAFDRYAALAGTGLTSTEIREIIPATAQGRVAALFVAEDQQQWGYYNEPAGEVHIHLQPVPGDEDLLDLAAANAYASKGQVFTRPSARMPGQGAVAAIFRY